MLTEIGKKIFHGRFECYCRRWEHGNSWSLETSRVKRIHVRWQLMDRKCFPTIRHETARVDWASSRLVSIQQLRILLDRVLGIRQSDWKSRQSWERVEFLCSHETTAQCCDSSFSVRVAQLVASVLISTLTSHAGLEPCQSQTHLPSQRAQHTCDTWVTLHFPNYKWKL